MVSRRIKFGHCPKLFVEWLSSFFSLIMELKRYLAHEAAFGLTAGPLSVSSVVARPVGPSRSIEAQCRAGFCLSARRAAECKAKCGRSMKA